MAKAKNFKSRLVEYFTSRAACDIVLNKIIRQTYCNIFILELMHIVIEAQRWYYMTD